MSARRFVSRTMLACCALTVGLLVALTGTAWGAFTHNFVSAFQRGGEPFSGVEGVAVDQASGDVYVYDPGFGEGAGAILKFDGSGAPLGFSGIVGEPNRIEGVGSAGEGEGELAVDDSAGPAKGDIYVAAGGVVRVYGANGVSLGSLIPPSGWGSACGVTVDPTGNLYVAFLGGSGTRVSRYAPSSSLVSSGDYTGGLWGVGNACQLASDSSGGVYVGTLPEGPVNRFEALQFTPVEMQSFGNPIGEGRAVSVDPSTDQPYVASYGQVSWFEANGGGLVSSFSGQEQGSFGNVHGLAVNGTTGRVYVADDEHGRIAIYGPTLLLADATANPASSITSTSAHLSGTVNPNGMPVTACVFEVAGQTVPCAASPGSGNEPVEVTATVTGLAPATAYSYRLAVTDANGTATSQEQPFTTFSAPTIDSTTVENAGYENATVTAKINPQGTASTYHFEYGTTGSYGTTVPIPDGPVGAGSEDVTVSVPLTGLNDAGTYHYRVVASNTWGVTNGPDHTFTTYTTPVQTADTCPNAEIRNTQFASTLPDCRAYELVSPPEKDGGNVAADNLVLSTPDGNAIKYDSPRAFGPITGASTFYEEYISQRSNNSQGWATHPISPPQKAQVVNVGMPSMYLAFSEDLSKGVYFAMSPIGPGHENVAESENLYLRTDLLNPNPDNYELLSDSSAPRPTKVQGFASREINFAAASKDFSHILFSSRDNLTPETSTLNPELPKAYEWHNGTVTLAGILPNGEPAESSLPGAGEGAGSETWGTDAMSSNGTRFIFTGGPLTASDAFFPQGGNIYMRIDGERSIQLNVSERSTPDPSKAPATFWGATADDSKVFFTTSRALTDEAIDPSAPRLLYMYDLNAPEGKHLTLISVDHEPSEGFNEDHDRVVGMSVDSLSADGGYVYFTGLNALVAGQEPVPYGQEELYVWHDGELRTIGRQGVHGSENREGYRGWSGKESYLMPQFRVTRDGLHAVFESRSRSVAKRAGVNIEGCNDTVGTCEELFEYDYTGDKLTCVSCNPSGALPVSSVETERFPPPDGVIANQWSQLQKRWLSSDGRFVFFDTQDALVPQDVNGHRDVYEYDSQAGRARLVSPGSCGCDSYFQEATPDGSDVFFMTHQSLVRADIDTAGDMYDARVNGGITGQNLPPVVACTGEECQGPVGSPPAFSVPSSASFSGPGNPAAAPVAGVRVKVKGLTRAQRLRQALRKCNAKRGARRVKCRSVARARFGKGSARRTVRRHGR